MDIQDCQSAIDLLIHTDIFISVFISQLALSGFSFLLRQLFEYFERRSWGESLKGGENGD